VHDYDATYSPDDNKLRLYAGGRLPQDTYERVRAEGFRWAPKQELFVAPAWSPAREDLLFELCGEIGDEDTSLTERAEERAERFEGYGENRAADAESAHAAVSRITDGIQLGQPILVGHHSEKHARRDADRIENGMRRAIKMWDTSKYWESRAAGAIRSAKYKQLPAVRARRIRTLEAERRKLVRDYTPREGVASIMQAPFYCPECWPAERNCGCTVHAVAKIEVEHVWVGPSGRGGHWAQKASLEVIEARSARTIAHLDRRLEYERALLEAEGASGLLDKPKRAKIWQKWGSSGEPIRYAQTEMSKAAYQKAYHESRWTVLSADRSHRIRFLSGGVGGNRPDHVVFLTDAKEHARPGAEPPKPPRVPDPPKPSGRPYVPPERSKFDDLREQLSLGVQTVSAPSLFATPRELAERMVREADVRAGMTVLEPSAGTGVIMREIVAVDACAVGVEVNPSLHRALEVPGFITQCCDFMEYEGGPIDRVVRNPPFEKGQDAAHVRRAFGMLKEGGRLVAVMSPGPFFRGFLADVAFREWFYDAGGTFEELPAGTFKEAGTGVESRLVTIDR